MIHEHSLILEVHVYYNYIIEYHLSCLFWFLWIQLTSFFNIEARSYGEDSSQQNLKHLLPSCFT